MTDASATQKGSVRVRFAPSPTGYLHVAERERRCLTGCLRAKRRHDDPADRGYGRGANKPELVTGIIEGLKWLGVSWDEGRTTSRSDGVVTARWPGNAWRMGARSVYARRKNMWRDHAEEGSGTQKCGGGAMHLPGRQASSPETKPALRFKVPRGERRSFFDAGVGGGNSPTTRSRILCCCARGKGKKNSDRQCTR